MSARQALELKAHLPLSTHQQGLKVDRLSQQLLHELTGPSYYRTSRSCSLAALPSLALNRLTHSLMTETMMTPAYHRKAQHQLKALSAISETALAYPYQLKTQSFVCPRQPLSHQPTFSQRPSSPELYLHHWCRN